MIFARDEAALAQTTGEIRDALGAEVDYHATDLTRVDDVRALVKRTVERFGGLDVLVSNAGGPLAGSFDTVSDEDWRGAFELNLMSVVKLVREALPHARTRFQADRQRRLVLHQVAHRGPRPLQQVPGRRGRASEEPHLRASPGRYPR